MNKEQKTELGKLLLDLNTAIIDHETANQFLRETVLKIKDIVEDLIEER